MKKLTKTQQIIIDHMKDGGRMMSVFGFRGEGTNVLFTKGGEHIHLRYPSISVLIEKGLLVQKQSAGGNDYFLK